MSSALTHASRFVDNDGVQIHYIYSELTTRTKAPIIFVPGMSDLAADYLEILPTLGRSVAVIDLRGHGASDSPTTHYALEDHLTDIEAVINNITNGPIHLMTFSRGTCYGLGWATTNPNRVLSISIGDYPAREIALPADTVDTFLGGRWRGTPVATRLTDHAARATFAAAVARDFWDDLAAIDVPLLVVRSTAVAPLTNADWDRYRAQFPDAELIELGTPHDIFRPDRHQYPDLVRSHVEAAEP